MKTDTWYETLVPPHSKKGLLKDFVTLWLCIVFHIALAESELDAGTSVNVSIYLLCLYIPF